MRNTWENLVHHVGTIYEHDISNKLLNKNTVTIKKSKHTQDTLDEHQLATEIREQSYKRLSKVQKGVYEEQVVEGEPTIAAKSKFSLAILNNEIVEAEYKSHPILPIFL